MVDGSEQVWGGKGRSKQVRKTCKQEKRGKERGDREEWSKET